MNDNRKLEAVLLREQGYSINDIALKLKAAKSSISIWTKHIIMTDVQREALQARAHSREAIEKRRTARLLNEAAKRNSIVASAFDEVGVIAPRELWLIGTALYWAEGGKTQRMVRFSNGDPKMIQLMMRYFRETCDVPEDKFRGHIHIHEHLDTDAAEAYWSEIAKIPRQKFYKTYNKPNISSKGLRNSLPYGVFDIYVADVTLFLKIQGWTKALYKT